MSSAANSSTEGSGNDRPSREVAYRLFATEFDDASLSYSESDEERAPNYVVTPTGARVNRLFAVGVLTEVEAVNDDVLRGRLVDPTGAFVSYAGQYQPDEMAFLDRASPPAFVALSGKARTFQPDDSDQVFTSVRPESMSRVDADTRDRWTVSTAEATLERIGVMAASLASGLTGETLRDALVAAGVDESLATGVPLALDHYGTTPAYLAALRARAIEALEVVADERDSVQSLNLDPASTGDPETPLATLSADLDLSVDDEVDAAGPAVAQGAEPSEEATPAATAQADAASSASDSGGTVEAATEEADDVEDEADEPTTATEEVPTFDEPKSTTADVVEESSTDTTADTTAAERTETTAEAEPTSTTEPKAPDEPSREKGQETTSTTASESTTASASESESETTTASASASESESETTTESTSTSTSTPTSTTESEPTPSKTADDLGDFEDSSGTGTTASAESPDDGGADTDDLGDFDAGSDESTASPEPDDASAATDADGMYELDEAERAEVEEEFGTEFSTGSEVAPAGEADIDVPSVEELEDELGDEPDEEPGGETAPSGTDEASAASADTDTEAEDAAAEDVDLESAAVEAMADLDDGDGASREAVVGHVVDEYGVDPDAVEDAIQSALMSGQCYEPTEDSLKAI